MADFHTNECRLCMNHRSVKPLNAEVVRRIGACFGIHINLDDTTLPRDICRQCTYKVNKVKKYRDFYLSVQAKLFIRRSNNFIRIDRQPLVQVVLSQHKTPRYIHPPKQPIHEKEQQRRSKSGTSSSDSGNVRTHKARVSRIPPRSTAKQTDPKIAATHRATHSPRSLACNRPVAESSVSDHRASPSPVTERRPSSEVALPVATTWHDIATPVEDKSEQSYEALEREQLEADRQTKMSLSEDNRPASATSENLEMEVLETDVQSQGETASFEDLTNLPEEPSVDTKETVELITAINMHSNAFEVVDDLDSDEKDDKYQELETTTLEIYETAENTEDTENVLVQKPIRNVQETRRRRRSKISGRELYKSLLTECNICGKKIERNRLEGHINRHSGRRPYGCPIEGCTSRFHCKHACRLHVRCRHGSETFSCTICGKEYKARRDLLGHVRETHVEPKFNCDICGKMFTTRSRLKQHRFYHTGERNYPCHVCEMRFFSNFQLKVHMRTHTKSFPYVCSVCNKSFRYRHMAKEHIVKDHGIDTTLQKEWVIQYPEPDPEEVEVVNTEKNIVRYNIQRLEEPDEEDEFDEHKEDMENSLTIDQSE